MEYYHEKNDKCMEVANQLLALSVWCHAGFGKADSYLAAAAMMTLMGAMDALVKTKDMDFGLVGTLGSYSPEDMKTGFPKAPPSSTCRGAEEWQR